MEAYKMIEYGMGTKVSPRMTRQVGRQAGLHPGRRQALKKKVNRFTIKKILNYKFCAETNIIFFITRGSPSWRKPVP